MLAAKFLDWTDWWFGEWRAIFSKMSFPSRLPRIMIGKDGFWIAGPDDRFVGSFEHSRLQDEIQTQRLQHCYVVIARDQAVIRSLSQTKLPHSRIREMALIDVEDHTPFTASHSFIVPLSSKHISKSSYALLKQSHLTEMLNAIKQTNVSITALGLDTQAGIVWLSKRSARYIDPNFRRASRGLIVAYGIFGLGCLLTCIHLQARLTNAHQALRETLFHQESQAVQFINTLKQQSQKLEAVDAAKAAKIHSVALVTIWEEATRILPDTAWVNSVSLQDDTLTLSGFAQSAAGLISLFEGSSLFHDATFISPVARMPGQDGEHFEIRLRVRAR